MSSATQNLRSTLGVAVVASIVTTLVLAAALAFGAIPAPTGVITSCYRNTDGQLRVVDAAKSCQSGFTRLQWMQAGTQLDSARVRSAIDQSVPANTNTPLSFELERWDSASLHDDVTQNSRLTAARAGLYALDGSVVWNVGSGARYVFIMLNGISILAAQQSSGAANAMHESVSTTYRLQAGDYVQLVVFSDTSGQQVLSAPNYSPEFSATRLGP